MFSNKDKPALIIATGLDVISKFHQQCGVAKYIGLSCLVHFDPEYGQRLIQDRKLMEHQVLPILK